jgi:hypothetical protein
LLIFADSGGLAQEHAQRTWKKLAALLPEADSSKAIPS